MLKTSAGLRGRWQAGTFFLVLLIGATKAQEQGGSARRTTGRSQSLGQSTEAGGPSARSARRRPGSRGGKRTLKPAVLDLATGMVTRGNRASLGDPCEPAPDALPNLDLGGNIGFGFDVGGGQVEWFCAAEKNSSSLTDLVMGLELAYCSAMADVSSGGPGGTARLGFYEGFRVGGTSPGTCVAAITLTGLPANTASSTLVGGGSQGYYLSLRGNPGSHPQFRELSNFVFADGPIGYSWRFLDVGTDGVMAGTAPFLACVASCSGYGPDGLGMVNALDRYAPPGTYDTTFTAQVPFSPSTQSSLAFQLREAPEQSRWYVNRAAGSAYFTGANWNCAFRDLQDALDVASPGDQIWVAEGTYEPTAGEDRSRRFQLKSGVTLYGGFQGFETNLLQRNPALHPTILSGDLLGDDGSNFSNYADNSVHVVVGNGTDLTAVLDGFVVRGGRASQGGGIYIVGGSPTIRNCTIEKNWAARGGGAYVGGAAAFINCTIRDNRGTTAGGGLELRAGASVVGCTIERNGSETTSSGVGGGIAGSGFRIESSTVQSNIAGQGGGLYDTGGSTIRTTQFLQNSSNSGGGALFNGSRTRVESCNFEGNRAYSGGGVQVNGTPLFVASTLLANTGTIGGGLLVRAPARVVACRIERNVALDRGGAAHVRNRPTFANCIVRDNESRGNGGAFFVDQPSYVEVVNCTVAGNRARFVGGGGSRGSRPRARTGRPRAARERREL